MTVQLELRSPVSSHHSRRCVGQCWWVGLCLIACSSPPELARRVQKPTIECTARHHGKVRQHCSSDIASTSSSPTPAQAPLPMAQDLASQCCRGCWVYAVNMVGCQPSVSRMSSVVFVLNAGAAHIRAVRSSRPPCHLQPLSIGQGPETSAQAHAVSRQGSRHCHISVLASCHLYSAGARSGGQHHERLLPIHQVCSKLSSCWRQLEGLSPGLRLLACLSKMSLGRLCCS